MVFLEGAPPVASSSLSIFFKHSRSRRGASSKKYPKAKILQQKIWQKCASVEQRAKKKREKGNQSPCFHFFLLRLFSSFSNFEVAGRRRRQWHHLFSLPSPIPLTRQPRGGGGGRQRREEGIYWGGGGRGEVTYRGWEGEEEVRPIPPPPPPPFPFPPHSFGRGSQAGAG